MKERAIISLHPTIKALATAHANGRGQTLSDWVEGLVADELFRAAEDEPERPLPVVRFRPVEGVAG